MSYTHLSQEERYQIRWLRKGGCSREAIGIELQRVPSTITPHDRTEDWNFFMARFMFLLPSKMSHSMALAG